MIKIEVNSRILEAERGETILSALRNNGIHVPTLCSMKDLSPTGACRMCVVELEGAESLVPACSFKVEEDMKINTHSPRVLRARKTNVELLLSNHPDDCLYCGRNLNCELQSLSLDMNVRERRIPGIRTVQKVDKSSLAIVRDPSKCILCGRCVRVCEEIMDTSTIDFAFRGNDLKISTALANPINFSNCTSCGQCLVVCPTGALTENVQNIEIEAALHDKEKIVAVQYSDASLISLAELLGLKPGNDLYGVVSAALKICGFDFVFETAYGADIMLLEQALIVYDRIESEDNLPLITSSCPAWINYVEQFYPELIPLLSPLRSPHQILGSLIKTWFVESQEIDAKNIFSVVVSPCTAAKEEMHRPELAGNDGPVIDAVMTTRELARLIRLNGIDFDQLEAKEADSPFRASSSAGKLCCVAGGEMEGIARTLYNFKNQKDMSGVRLSNLRIAKSLKEISIKPEKKEIAIAAVSGLKKVSQLLNDVRSGHSKYHLIEVMACPDGCVNGGGQAIQADENFVRSRIKTIYEEDNQAEIRMAHLSSSLSEFYKDYLDKTGSTKGKELFFTSYSEKDVLR